MNTPFINMTEIISQYIDINFNPNKRYTVIKPKKHFEKRIRINTKSITNNDGSGISLSDYYKYHIETLFPKDISINNWVNTVIYPYINYLLYAEKCYFYNNAEDNYIYGEILDNGDRNFFYQYKDGDMWKDAKNIAAVRISFSPLKNIPKLENSLLDDYLGNDIDINETICNIDIKRKYGKETKNNYHWILGNDLDVSDSSDDELLLVIIGMINRAIIRQFNESLIHNIYKRVNIFGGIGTDWRNIEKLCIVEDI